MSIQCFLVKESKYLELKARRYVSSEENKCPNYPFHNAEKFVGYRISVPKKIGEMEFFGLREEDEIPKDELIWPTKCDHCDYKFTEDDVKQDFIEKMMVKVDSLDEDISNLEIAKDNTPYIQQGLIYVPKIWWPRRSLPAGAMYFESWLPKNFFWDNKDDQHLIVVVPGPTTTEWNIDSKASNCTLQNDRTHRCWIREGVPPNVTVGKNGFTCQAGGGSIVVLVVPGWHGFLRNGFLESV